jgi:hypothetical protein
MKKVLMFCIAALIGGLSLQSCTEKNGGDNVVNLTLEKSSVSVAVDGTADEIGRAHV